MPHEQAEVHDALERDLRRLFFDQSVPDQRHAFEVAARAGGGSERTEAALLHDVGKAASGLGAVGRALATICAVIGLPLRGDWLAYVHHGDIGAHMLEAAGARNLAVNFALAHPGPVPDGVDPTDWRALADADEA